MISILRSRRTPRIALNVCLAEAYRRVNSPSAASSRSSPPRTFSVSPPIPIRKCCGAPKNRPGTTVVSYLSRNSEKNVSASPLGSFGKTTVPAGRAVTFELAMRVEKRVQ